MRFTAVLLVLGCSVAAAQPPRTLAERLGHPRDAKLLIIHADDIGVARSVNRATWDAFRLGAITSASIMMPTRWVSEVAEYARANPQADLGLHLTLTSEWKTERWGPISPRDRVPSLLDSTGMLWTRETMVRDRARLEDAEREVRAQIELAQRLGIRPTHVDSHMRSLFSRADLYAMMARVAREHGLSFRATVRDVRPGTNQPPLLEGEIALDASISIGDGVPAGQWRQWYLDAVRNLKPGITELVVHVGYDDAELRSVTEGFDAWGAAWRQRDFDVLTSAEFRQALRDNGVVLVTWREVQRAARAK